RAYGLETGEGLDAKLEIANDLDGVALPLGRLGPSLGKWRLLVRSRGLADSGELVIVSLIATPTGHLTNLSADHLAHGTGARVRPFQGYEASSSTRQVCPPS
ncbi:MAG: hypothetical protein OXH09_13420, partial [Gammaproteobacteria bacterium]|nr:hypothetical protein [Gammaproteobacteria bacterium]